MANLDSILKIKDITLPTKVHLFEATVFQVVMYGCESWGIGLDYRDIEWFKTPILWPPHAKS